jgi:formylglycine-generating enzyme required for sulfatase activity
VDRVSFYDALVFCNILSMVEGKTPVYSIGGSTNPVDWGVMPSSNTDAVWGAVSIAAGDGYRLPTEMQWKWAAMGADKTVQPNTGGYTKEYAGSAEAAGVYANIGGYAWYALNSGNKTHEVGKKAANELGLKDMSGNVAEWCWDWNGWSPSEELTLIDYAGAASGHEHIIGYQRVFLGAAYNSTVINGAAAHVFRLVYRDYTSPSGALFSHHGLRVVCPAD